MDRELVRAIARVLTEDTRAAERMRLVIKDFVKEEKKKEHKVLNMLLNSPLAGSELDLTRERVELREIDL